MYERIIDRRPTFSGLVQVRTPADIEYLVKESEVVTGKPGRKFVIGGADRVVYRIQWSPSGYHVQRLDEAGNATSAMYVQPESFAEHSVGNAMREGYLFTPTLAQ